MWQLQYAYLDGKPLVWITSREGEYSEKSIKTWLPWHRKQHPVMNRCPVKYRAVRTITVTYKKTFVKH